MQDEIIRLFPRESAHTNHNSQHEASEMAPDDTELESPLAYRINVVLQGLYLIVIGLQLIGIVWRIFNIWCCE